MPDRQRLAVQLRGISAAPAAGGLDERRRTASAAGPDVYIPAGIYRLRARRSDRIQHIGAVVHSNDFLGHAPAVSTCELGCGPHGEICDVQNHTQITP